MSFLDDFFQPDKEKDLEKAERQRKRKAAQKAKRLKRQEKKKEARFENKKENAIEKEQRLARQFFNQQGANPKDYGGDIDAYISNIAKGVNYGDNLKQIRKINPLDIYDPLQTSERKDALTRIGKVDTRADEFGPDIDDQIINDIIASQRAGAQDYTNNLQNRGLIRQSGYDAAVADIDAQEAEARKSLEELGNTFRTQGQGKLKDIINKARLDAQDLKLGEDFGFKNLHTSLEKAFDDFMSGLQGDFAGVTPPNLFTTENLANIAGAQEGLFNPRKFSMAALSGLQQDEDEDEQNRGTGSTFF